MAMSDEQSVADRLEGLLASEDVEEVQEEAPESPEEEEDGQAEEDAEPEAEYEAEEEAEEETDEEDPEGDDDAAPAESIEVEVDGQLRRLTRDEVRDGILLRSDYSRKTQQLAEERRQFESERQQAAAQFKQQFEALQTLQEPEPDWDKLYDEDPIGAPKIERDWRVKQQQRDELQQQQAMQSQQAMQARLVSEAARLPEFIPEWADQNVARAEQDELRQALIDDGFRPEDVAQIADARLVKWLRAAHRQFKGEKSAKETVKKKVVGKPKVQKPGSAKPKASTKSVVDRKRAAARQSQSPNAWTEVFKEFVG